MTHSALRRWSWTRRLPRNISAAGEPAPPFRTAEMDLLFGQGISREGGLIDLGVEQGIVRKSGAWYTCEGDQLGQGKENARNFLRDNPDLASGIEKKIKEKLGVGPLLAAEDDAPGGTAGAWFGEATFENDAWFGGATFEVTGGFGLATFKGIAGFEKAIFEGTAEFGEATFKEFVRFNGATFKSYTWFTRATLKYGTEFGGATFESDARFGGATFKGTACFAEPAFETDDVGFSEAAFKGNAGFSEARFDGDVPVLGHIAVEERLDLDGVQFTSAVRIDTSAKVLTCRRGRFRSGVRFDVCRAVVLLDDSDLSVPSLLTGPPPRAIRQPRLLSLQGADVAGLTLGNVSLADCRFAGAYNLDKLRLEADAVFGLSPAVAGWERRQTIAEETAWRAARARYYSSGL